MLTLRQTAVCALVAGFSFAGAASAQVRSWNMGDITPTGSCASSAGGTTAAFGNTWNCSEQPTGSATTLQVSAFSNNSGSTYAAAAVNYQGVNLGIGAYNTTEGLAASSPDHSVDNSGLGMDMMLLSFTTSQILKSVSFGWTFGDADFQVLRWTGGALTATAGRTAAQLLTDGWALVSNVDGSAAGTYGVNTGNLSSSYWLVTAFNSAFGGSAGSVGVDGFKLLGVSSGLPGTSVSSPGTLALAGLALVGMFGVRRRA